MSTHEFVMAVEGFSSLDGPWHSFRVVQFDATERMNHLFRYEIIALVQGDDYDPESLIGKRCSIRIATQSLPAFRVVHGVITAAEDAGHDLHGPLYRLIVEPPLVRAAHRTRYRIFLDKTLRQIIESILQEDTAMTLAPGSLLEMALGGPTFKPAKERFTWRIGSSPRLDDPKARPYVVQYGESDLNFISRLMEEEGIGYHFEHDDETSLLVFSDKDFGRPRISIDDTFAPGKLGRSITQFRMKGRLRAQNVELGEYNWEKPALQVDVTIQLNPALDLSKYSFPGGYGESAEQGQPLAQAQAEALHSESNFATGAGTTRLLAPGSIFSLEHPKPRLEGEYLVTAIHIFAYQAGVLASEAANAPKEPYRVEIECACRGRGNQVEESRFRPQRSTPKPRIFGTQTAFVTAEPNSSAEINLGGSNSIGCVRVKFHWDTDKQRQSKEAGSKWIRVSEPMARGGQGGIWHPRVGTEVIVEYEEGDPDRPVVTGRVYNGKNRPAKTNGAHSTLLSLSTPGGGVRNEITFEDTAGSERIYTNAGKDMTANVGNNRLENVGVNAFMHIGVDNTEQVDLNQTVEIGGNDTLDVGGNQEETIGGNRLRLIGLTRSMFICGNETRHTASNNANGVGISMYEAIFGNVVETYGALRTTAVVGKCSEFFLSSRTQTVSALALQVYGGEHKTTVSGSRFITAGAMIGEFVLGNVETTVSGAETINAGAAAVFIASGKLEHKTPNLTISTPLKVHVAETSESEFAAEITMSGCSLNIHESLTSDKKVSLVVTGFFGSKIDKRTMDTGLNLTIAGNVLKTVGTIVHTSGIHVFT